MKPTEKFSNQELPPGHSLLNRSALRAAISALDVKMSMGGKTPELDELRKSLKVRMDSPDNFISDELKNAINLKLKDIAIPEEL